MCSLGNSTYFPRHRGSDGFVQKDGLAGLANHPVSPRLAHRRARPRGPSVGRSCLGAQIGRNECRRGRSNKPGTQGFVGNLDDPVDQSFFSERGVERLPI